MDTSVSILLIDGDPADADRVRQSLTEAGSTHTVEQACTLAQGLERVRAETYGIVILSLELPDAEGLQCIERFKSAGIDLPMLVLSGVDDRTAALEAVKAGAQDYLVKQYINGAALARVISYSIERHRLLKELDGMRTQEIKIKDQFLSDVAHELRTPLACIYQFATILRDGIAGEVSEDQKEYFDIIVNNAQHLNRMMSDLLDLARHKTGRLSVSLAKLSMVDVLGEVVHMLQSAAAHEGILLSLEADDDVPFVYADDDRVRQVLTNLVNNSLKFTPSGGSITVRIYPYEHIVDFVRVDVMDTGCGMNEETLSRMFDRHYQDREAAGRSRKGLGLGLYICKELVEAQGGLIWATSELDKGSTVSFAIPAFGLRRFLVKFFEDAGGVPQGMGVIMIRVTSQGESILTTSSEQKVIIDGVRLALDPVQAALIPDLYEASGKGIFFVGVANEEAMAQVVKDLRLLFSSRHGLAAYEWTPELLCDSRRIDQQPTEEAAISCFVSAIESRMQVWLNEAGVTVE